MHSPRPSAVATALAALLLGGSTAIPAAAALSPVRGLPFPAPEVQGIAYGGGSLWVAGSMGPGMTLVFEMDPISGAVRSSFVTSATVGSMTHDGSQLFATSDAGALSCGGSNPNSVSVLDPGSGAVVRTMASPVTGMASGLAFVGARFFAAGQLDPDACTPGDESLAIAEANPADGSSLGSFGVSALGSGPRDLASDGYNLLYGAWGGDSGDPFLFHWNVHSLSTSGSESAVASIDDIIAPDPTAAEQSFHVTGMAWGGDELFVADASSGQVLVYAFPAAPPPPPPPSEIAVGVDVKPGDSMNEIKLHSNGHVPVAILGAADFNVNDVNVSSVVFGGAHAKMKPNGSPFLSMGDVNGDGQMDMVLRFDTEDLQLVGGDYYADVTGSTNDDRAFRGSDFVHVVGPGSHPYDRRKLRPREGDAFVVEDPSANASLRVDSVWPNPAPSGARLVFTLGSNEPASVEMWSVSGRLMSRRDLGALGAGAHSVDLSEARALPNGVYFVQILQGFSSARTKVIVQR